MLAWGFTYISASHTVLSARVAHAPGNGTSRPRRVLHGMLITRLGRGESNAGMLITRRRVNVATGRRGRDGRGGVGRGPGVGKAGRRSGWVALGRAAIVPVLRRGGPTGNRCVLSMRCHRKEGTLAYVPYCLPFCMWCQGPSRSRAARGSLRPTASHETAYAGHQVSVFQPKFLLYLHFPWSSCRNLTTCSL